MSVVERNSSSVSSKLNLLALIGVDSPSWKGSLHLRFIGGLILFVEYWL